MTAGRVLLASAGVVIATYGGWLLVSRQDVDQIAGAVAWLVGGVLVHDAVLAPLTILLAAVAVRWLPDEVRRPAAVALIVVGPLTLLAVPVLSGFGAKPGNAGLQDRPYLTSWLALVALAVVAVAVAAVVVRSLEGRRAREEDSDGTGARGR